MTADDQPQRRDADALGRRLADDARAMQQPLPPAVKHRVMSQLHRDPAVAAASERRHPAVIAAAGIGLVAAAVLLAATVSWLAGPPAQTSPEVMLVEAGPVQSASPPADLPTWEDLQRVEQPWDQETQDMMQDAVSVGRFLLARAAVPVEF